MLRGPRMRYWTLLITYQRHPPLYDALNVSYLNNPNNNPGHEWLARHERVDVIDR